MHPRGAGSWRRSLPTVALPEPLRWRSLSPPSTRCALMIGGAPGRSNRSRPWKGGAAQGTLDIGRSTDLGGPMDFKTIRYELDAGVLTLTLNRPDRLNAFNNTMMHEMIAALDAADADDSVRAIIVTGEGRGFCAGADLEKGGDTFDYDAQGRSEEGRPAPRDGGGLLTLRIYECNKPMIAAVNGPAVGVGATMQLPMDIRLASENAKFGFVFSRRYRARGLLKLLPPTGRGHQPGPGVGLLRARVPSPRGPRRRPREGSIGTGCAPAPGPGNRQGNC